MNRVPLESRNNLTNAEAAEVREWVRRYYPRWQAIGWTGRDIAKAAEDYFPFPVSPSNVRRAHTDLNLPFGCRARRRYSEPLVSPNPGPAASIPNVPEAEGPATEVPPLHVLSDNVRHSTGCHRAMNQAMIECGSCLSMLDQYLRPALDGIAASLDKLVQILKSYGPLTGLPAADTQQIKEQVQRLHDVWIEPQPQGDARA